MPRITLDPVPFGVFFLFVLGFLLAAEVQIIGRLLVGEVLLIPVALLGLFTSIRKIDYGLWKFAGFYCLTLFAYIAADTINGSATNDALRGWARVAFVIVSLLAMRLILKQSRFNLFPICVGMGVGGLFFQMVVGSFKLFSNRGFSWVWKFYVSALIIASGLYLIAWLSKRFMFIFSCVFLGCIAIFSAVIDCRAVAGFCVLVAGVLAARLISAHRLRTLLPVFLIGGILLAGLASWLLLSETNDAFGERRASANTARFAALITAAETIVQHPIIGVGSWTQLAEAADRHRQAVQSLGQSYDSESLNQTGHSQLLQAWTEAGIFAALAFMYYLWRLLMALKWMLRKPLDRFYAVELFFLVNGIWACLFSPFNGSQRVYIGIVSSICIVLAEEQKTFDRNTLRQRKIMRQRAADHVSGGSAVGLQSA